MPDNIDRILIQYGIDQSALDTDKQQTIAKIRSIATEAAKTTGPSGEAAGQTFAKGFGNVSEREIKKGFRDIKDGAVLVFSFLGSFLGATFSDKFSESAKGLFTGALAGLGVGAFFGPLGIAIGTGIGAVLGGITGYFEQIRKETATVADLAKQFNLSKEYVQELFDSAKQFGTQDKLGDTLKTWKDLMEEIVKLNPEVIKAVGNIFGISGKEAAKLSAQQLGEIMLFGLGVDSKGGGAHLFSQLIDKVIAYNRQVREFQSMSPFEITGEEAEKKMRRRGIKRPEITEEMFNHWLVQMEVEDRVAVVGRIAKIFKGENPLRQFLDAYNTTVVGNVIKYGKQFVAPNQNPFDRLLKEEQQEDKLHELLDPKFTKYNEMKFEALSIEEKLKKLTEDRQRLENVIGRDVQNALDIEMNKLELNKKINDLEQQRKRNLKEIQSTNKEISEIVGKYFDRSSFGLNELATGGMSDQQRSRWQQFLAPNFNDPRASWFIEASRYVQLWEAQARQATLIGDTQAAENLRLKADELRLKIDPLSMSEKNQTRDLLQSLNDKQEQLNRLAAETGVKIIPSMGK